MKRFEIHGNCDNFLDRPWARKREWRIVFSYIPIYLAAMLAAVVGEVSIDIETPGQLASSICVFGSIVVWSSAFLWFICRRCAYQSAVDRRLDRVPLITQRRALDNYPGDWVESAIECYESHIGGDCPLCGAE